MSGSEEEKEAEDATVNRSLQLLSQAYGYAVTSDPPKLNRAPKIGRYSEKGNQRKRKFSSAEAKAELNPLKRVCKLIRRRCLHNRYFENLQDVISAVESEFATWITRNDVLRRLCALT